MPRVLAAIIAALALVAANVPVAAAMPPHCSECCRHDAMHAADAPMSDCCRVAPAERPVARETAATPVALTSAWLASCGIHTAPLQRRPLAPAAPLPRVAVRDVLRI